MTATDNRLRELTTAPYGPWGGTVVDTVFLRELAAELLAARATIAGGPAAAERERCARLCDAASARWAVPPHGASANTDARRERSNEAAALAAEIRGGAR